MLESLVEEKAAERQELVRLVRKYADVNTDGVLDQSCQTFVYPGIEGFIAYIVKGSNAVVYGDPVSAYEDKPFLAEAFQKDCENKKLGVVYTIVSQEFAEWAYENMEATSIEFGEKFIFDPQNNPVNNKGPKAVLVRKKVKQAVSKGVVVKEYFGENPEIQIQIEAVANAWLEKRQGPQIYLAAVTLFNDFEGKRLIYAEQSGRVVGFLMLNLLQNKDGWLLNNVMMTKDAPNGLTEMLVISTLQILEKEGCKYVLVGPVPGRELGEVNGINKIHERLARFVFKTARYIFNLDGHATFWEKFSPKSEGCYLVFPKKNLGYQSIKSVFQAYHVSKG